MNSTSRFPERVVSTRKLRSWESNSSCLRRASFPALKAALAEALKSSGATFQSGASWSCDAPFRETFERAAQHAAKGALVVEMEAAGLFAAGQHLGVQVAALFTVADGISGDGANAGWRMDFDPQKVRGGLVTALLAAVALLAAAARGGERHQRHQHHGERKPPDIGAHVAFEEAPGQHQAARVS